MSNSQESSKVQLPSFTLIYKFALSARKSKKHYSFLKIPLILFQLKKETTS
jgi:hypothetical protein